MEKQTTFEQNKNKKLYITMHLKVCGSGKDNVVH